MSGRYATTTTVPVEKSRGEIESILTRYGADAFAYSNEPGRATIGFRVKDTSGTTLCVRMTLPTPKKSDFETNSRGNLRNAPTIQSMWEQACRSGWRAMFLVIKAKLEACAAGISTVEREFLADVVTPNGQTIGEQVRPQLAAMSARGETPRLLLTGASSNEAKGA